MSLLTTLQILAVSGSLMTPVAAPGVCQIRTAPTINIQPQTKAILYDTKKTSAELTAMQSNTISPYGLNVDQATGGLRHDKPRMSYAIDYNVAMDERTNTFCMSYKSIDVKILLQPKIYIAKEYNIGRCGREVMEHEKKHVKVDRQVINKYSRKMGLSVQNAVNTIGAIGPFPVSRMDEMRTFMAKHITSSLDAVMLPMKNEMNARQQQVDSLEEYERVGSHCEKNAKKAFKNIAKQNKKSQR